MTKQCILISRSPGPSQHPPVMSAPRRRNSANICGFHLGNRLRTVASKVIATKISNQPDRRRPDPHAMPGHNGKPAINEFDMHPVNQQRALAHFDERTESPLPCSPAAPCVTQEENDQHDSNANQKKIRAGVPEIVSGVKLHGARIEPQSQRDERNPAHPSQRQRERFASCAPIRIIKAIQPPTLQTQTRPTEK